MLECPVRVACLPLYMTAHRVAIDNRFKEHTCIDSRVHASIIEVAWTIYHAVRMQEAE